MKAQHIVDTIRRALDAAGLVQRPSTRAQHDVRELIEHSLRAAGLAPPTPAPQANETPAGASSSSGEFLTLEHEGAQGRRDYRLYVPTSYRGEAMPLLVMLHGCKQHPDDFAAGTRMNEHAERHGFLVAYPAQTPRDNGANCWNWFERAQQRRGGAEPALIAGIVKEVSASHAVQRGKVYAAGLSAGASMAVILGRAYPDVFAAVAAHSGLPVGAAHDVASAFAAMHGGATVAPDDDGPGVRTLVIHGDADTTVNARNGAAIVERAVQAFDRHGTALQALTRLDMEAGGRRCTSTTFADPADRVLVEHLVVHGGTHAWSGGSASGSYTDSAGPDASAEIVRFFLELPE